MSNEGGLPKARRYRLIVRDMGDEVLLYDLDRDKVHCLNKSAAEVWQRCDGRTTPAEIAGGLRQNDGKPVDERLVWLALEQLGRDHLLEHRVPWPPTLPRVTRREAVRLIGIGAAIAVPLVTSIIAPTPVQAATCLTHCSSCSTGTQCCSGVCANNPSGCASGMRCV